MKVIVHNGEKLQRIFSFDNQSISFKTKSCTKALWLLAEKYPDELICWCDEELISQINFRDWSSIFHHDLIMASFAVKTQFLSESIGYVDHFPFVKVNRKVQYPTWMMSGDVGGIKGEVLLQFKDLLGKIESFGFLINSLGKLGQQNGLICYSTPELIERANAFPKITGSVGDLFKFVYMHYSTPWFFILLWCFIRYEKAFPLQVFLNVGKIKKVFQKEVDLSGINVISRRKRRLLKTVDVIIPTIGRPEHLVQVVKDLAHQTFLPAKVIIVEQNPVPSSKSELAFLKTEEWPFIIEHEFVHQTGVCNARNLALTKTTGDLIFFCDDDNRLSNNLLKDIVSEIDRYGLDVLVTAYLQPDEKIFFKKVKQWGTFGAGNAVARRKSLEGISFSPEFEHGYGEDVDYGIQLRNAGYDIVYHPGIKIIHLKAPMGGFRGKPKPKMEKEKYKPSPTVMALALKHFTSQQIKGFKASFFIKYFQQGPTKNPVRYLRQMNRRWKTSENRAKELLFGANFNIEEEKHT